LKRSSGTVQEIAAELRATRRYSRKRSKKTSQEADELADEEPDEEPDEEADEEPDEEPDEEANVCDSRRCGHLHRCASQKRRLRQASDRRELALQLLHRRWC
jgi:hypothetical protein